MRWTVLAVLLLTAPASAQTAAGPAEIGRLLHDFESRPGDPPLRCDVTTLGPVPNFAFRFEAGYTFHVPLSQYPGATQGWRVLTTITPQDSSRQRTFLVARYQPSDVTKTDLNFDIAGLYFLGVGRYSVEAALRDDRNRVCRKQWQVVVKPSRGDHGVQSALPPDIIRPISALSWPDTRHPDRTAPLRLSLLLNAAAFSTRGTALRAIDRQVLLSALTALLERLPTASVRLVVFSLEQQREIYRNDDFALPALAKVADAVNTLQLATVDVHVLQKPLGHVDFFTSLVNRELHAPDPSDTVVFLGPPSRYGNRIPEDVLPKPVSAKPRFFYLQYQGPRHPGIPMNSPGGLSGQTNFPGGRSGGMPSDSSAGESSADPSIASADTPHLPPRPPPSTGSGSTSGTGGTGGSGANSGSGVPGMGGGSGGRGGRGGGSGMPPPSTGGEREADIISAAMARLKGKTLAIHSPADLAEAIRKIEGKR